MKPTLKVIALLALSGSLASAASTAIAAYYDASFRTSAGVLLDTNFTAKIGWTAATSFNTTADFDTINAVWTNAGNITFASGDATGYNGYFSGTVSYSNAVQGLQDKSIFVWVTDGANQNFVAQVGQVFADDADGIANSNTFDMYVDFNGASTEEGMTYLLGGFSPATEDGFGGNSGNWTLNTAIPEPSAALLGAIGAIGLLRRRRI